MTLLPKGGNSHKGSKKSVAPAKWRARSRDDLLVGMKVVHPQVLFRGGGQPFRSNNREWYPREASGLARGLRVLERMVIMERCILTMFITEGARYYSSLSAPRSLLSWNFSRCGRACILLYLYCTMHSYYWTNQCRVKLALRFITELFEFY